MSSEFIAHASLNTNHSSPFRFILSHILRHPVVGILMVIGAFSNAALAAAVPYFIGQAFNTIIAGNTIEAIVPMVLAVIASQLLRGALQLMRNFSSEIFAQRIERDVRDELYASLLGKSMTFHDMQPVGEIMARVTNDVREMNLMMNPGLNMVVGSGFFLIVPLFAAPTLYPALGLTPILFSIVYFWAQYRFVKTMNPIAQKVREGFGDMNAKLAETLDGLQVVKGAAKEEDEITSFNSRVDAVRNYFIQQGKIEARYLPYLLYGLSNVGGLIHAVILYQAGIINTGTIIAYMGMLFLFQFPVFSSLGSLSQVSLGYAGAKRILEIINTETDLDQNEQGYNAPMKGAITFRNVNFSYTGSNRSIYDVSFEVYAGHTVAIVGQTGSGKSTIIKLTNRTYDVESGEVLIDDVNVRDWSLAALRSQISIIEQDIFLLSRSIADNIRFGKLDATQEEVEEAAKKAQAHEFIMSFPEGYNTVVGQRGVTLSGGQRQRIAIARAFLADPPILVLDDSTSAIDSATEDKIQKAIWAASRGRTTLLITHQIRIETVISGEDRLTVLEYLKMKNPLANAHTGQNSAFYQRERFRFDWNSNRLLRRPKRLSTFKGGVQERQMLKCLVVKLAQIAFER